MLAVLMVSRRKLCAYARAHRVTRAAAGRKVEAKQEYAANGVLTRSAFEPGGT